MHRWIWNSGTTHICRDCGCMRIKLTRTPVWYTQWSTRLKDWKSIGSSTRAQPACHPDRSYTVPDYIKAERS